MRLIASYTTLELNVYKLISFLRLIMQISEATLKSS